MEKRIYEKPEIELVAIGLGCDIATADIINSSGGDTYFYDPYDDV